MHIADALAYLDAHTNYEKGGKSNPSLDVITRLCDVMGDPQHAAPVVHITGTNGKGSTTAMVTRLLVEHGLTVGTYTSPHLERLNERIARNGEPIPDDELADSIAGVADAEMVAGVRPTFFEIMTAAAFRWFADIAVDAMVIEVGMLGRWDATNVVDAQVAVCTNVGMDHNEFAGPLKLDVAREKAGIVKPASTLVLGDTDPDVAAIFHGQHPARSWQRELDFDVVSNRLALGGRLLDLRTPLGSYTDVFLSLHGEHQGDNAVVAVSAVEGFFDAPVQPDLLANALGDTRVPGRLEVLGHRPLVILDGAHNPDGIERLASSMLEDFAPAGGVILVVGFLRGRDTALMLDVLGAADATLVVCCEPDSPRAVPATEVARLAQELGAEAVVADSVAEACRHALSVAADDDAVLVCGSLYVVGEARTVLAG
jgi:dihydrofolate synthase / folylpolyglutamate synthase